MNDEGLPWFLGYRNLSLIAPHHGLIAPIGSERAELVFDPDTLRMDVYLLRQSGNTQDFIFPLDVIIRYISQIMTLEPGDLIATGTPKGVGPVVAGDAVEVSIEGIGQLRNPVADQP